MREINWKEESEDHIWSRHRVTPAEVEQAVYTRPRLTTNGRNGTTYIFGQTSAGRYLVVVLSESRAGGHHVVTARDMTDKERRAFHRKAQ